jgi:hypothetical protein
LWDRPAPGLVQVLGFDAQETDTLATRARRTIAEALRHQLERDHAAARDAMPLPKTLAKDFDEDGQPLKGLLAKTMAKPDAQGEAGEGRARQGLIVTTTTDTGRIPWPSRRSRPSSKPSKARAPRPRRAAKPAPPRAADSEPEVLGDGVDPLPEESPTAARAAPAVPAKREPVLDRLVEWLEGQAEQLVPVRVAVTGAYGQPVDAAGELSSLRLIKGDTRFRIVAGSGGNSVGLVARAGAPEVQTTLADIGAKIDAALAPPAAAPATLGEHVAAAKGRPQRITWPHDTGTSVLLLTKGHPPRKAVIRNIHDHGGYVLYDLNVGEGTCDGVPADRIGRDLDAEGEVAQLRLHIAVLERHRDRGIAIAQRRVEMAKTELTMAEALSKHRKSMAEVDEQLAEHARCEPGQQDIRDVVGDGTEGKPKRGEKMAAKPSAKEDKLAAAAPPAPAALSTVELEATGWSIDDLLAARFNRSTASTGKPQQVKPVFRKRADGTADAFVVVDVERGVAALLPLWTKEQWAKTQQPSYGYPLELPTTKVPDRLSKGGALNGTPVRVKRATCYLGGDADALLVRLPAAEAAGAEPARASGKDAAAGG